MRKPVCGHRFIAWVSSLILHHTSTVAPCLTDLLAGDFKFNSVLRFDDATGAEVRGGIPPGSAGLQATAGVTVRPDGNIYVSSQNTGEILFYDGRTGAPLRPPLPGRNYSLASLQRSVSEAIRRIPC